MRLKEIYELFIREGIKADLRTRQDIHQYLRHKRKEYRTVPQLLKKFFDKESLSNPYADTRILYGDNKTEIKNILVGIDIEVGELLLARQLREEGQPIDLVLAHHPEGVALAALDDVMHLQVDLLHKVGLEKRVAKDLMLKRVEEVNRRLHSHNHARVVDTAQLLGIPFLCCHTPSDNHVAGYLQNLMDKKRPKTLHDILKLLCREPEYQEAMALKAGPMILVGKPQDKAGKVWVDMTGGTEGSKEIFARLSQAGIQTVLCMHLSEDHYTKVKSEYLNVVNAGHIASDNLGMNLLLDKLERKEKFNFIECSGFRRTKRSWD